jgi:hypothetical protein
VIERKPGRVAPTRPQRLLWGLAINGVAFAAWAAEALDRQRGERGRVALRVNGQTPFVSRTE